MKNKVINLFSRSEIMPSEGVKYSELLEQFLAPFTNDFRDEEYVDDIFEFAIVAWNFGNIKMIIPTEEFNKMQFEQYGSDPKFGLLERMIDYKIKHFKEFKNFMIDFDLTKRKGIPVLSVSTEEPEAYFSRFFDDSEIEEAQFEFEENFINRSAITIRPLQPFLEWYSNLDPDDRDDYQEMQSTKIYLVNDNIKDLEAWLKKKFDKIFMFELEEISLNKKAWPQKRNFKMFREWFQFEVSTMVFDFEKQPVFKSE